MGTGKDNSYENKTRIHFQGFQLQIFIALAHHWNNFTCLLSIHYHICKVQLKYFLITSMLIYFLGSLMKPTTHYWPWARCFFSLAGWETVTQNQNLHHLAECTNKKKHLHQGGSKLWKIILFLLISWATCKMTVFFSIFSSSWFTVTHSSFLRFSIYVCLRTCQRFIKTPGGRILLLQQQSLDCGVNFSRTSVHCIVFTFLPHTLSLFFFFLTWRKFQVIKPNIIGKSALMP